VAPTTVWIAMPATTLLQLRCGSVVESATPTEGIHMFKKFALIALTTVAFGFAARANAGTEMITDNSAAAPAYNYAPAPPPVVYYAPVPVGVVVYPGYAYYGARFRGGYGYRRVYARGFAYRGGRRWR
jgi:hypothetical protein